jgi:hypothetical protein
VRHIDFNADDLVAALMHPSPGHHLCILDSCGVSHLGSRLMIAGVDPVETIQLTGPDADRALAEFERFLQKGRPVIFTP